MKPIPTTALASLAMFVIGIGVGFVLFSSPPDGDQNGVQSVERLRVGTVESVDAQTATYQHPTYGFSLTYPSELIVQEFDEVGGETIVFQKPQEQKGFQLYITPYADTTISESRIKNDIPSGIIREPTEVLLAGDIRGLLFWSEVPVIGESRELWFVHDGYLYQVTTYAPLDAWLADIMSTFRFN